MRDRDLILLWDDTMKLWRNNKSHPTFYTSLSLGLACARLKEQGLADPYAVRNGGIK